VRVLATHSIRQFPLHFPSRASPCATRFRTSSTHKTFSWIHNRSHIAGFIIKYIASIKALNGFRSYLLSSTGLPFHAATSRNLRCNKHCSQQCYM